MIKSREFIKFQLYSFKRSVISVAIYKIEGFYFRKSIKIKINFTSIINVLNIVKIMVKTNPQT